MKFFFIRFLLYNRVFLLKKKSLSLKVFLWQVYLKYFSLRKKNCLVNTFSKRAFTSKVNLSRYNFKRLQSLGFLPFFKK